MNKIHIITGPTASGKSAQAITLAQQQNGVIFNADATQCYANLSILSARPAADELAQADHRLYGIWRGDKLATVADWLEVLTPQIQECWQQGKLPIICGGTGFYIKALMEGLSPIPTISPEIRRKIIENSLSQPSLELYAKLQTVDPATAEVIDSANTQRLIRALEVFEGTGKPMSWWQAQPKEPPFANAEFSLQIIELPREELYARCNQRFDIMLEKGAIEEVEQLLTKNYATDLPLMKAVGVPELSRYLAGELSLEAASDLAKQTTRRYAKRQLTWLRNQF